MYAVEKINGQIVTYYKHYKDALTFVKLNGVFDFQIRKI